MQEEGAREAAIMGLAHKAPVAEAGGIDALVALLRRPLNPEILVLSLLALHNLSSLPANQPVICRKALYLLLKLNRTENVPWQVREGGGVLARPSNCVDLVK